MLYPVSKYILLIEIHLYITMAFKYLMLVQTGLNLCSSFQCQHHCSYVLVCVLTFYGGGLVVHQLRHDIYVLPVKFFMLYVQLKVNIHDICE